MSKFAHYELNTSDPDSAKSFYAEVFGWTYQEMPVDGGGTYTMIVGDEGPFGGMQRKPMETVPDHWLGYIGVPNIEDTIAVVQKAGGTLLAGVIDIPGMGKYAVFTDPTGSAFAAWEAAPRPDAPATQAPKKKAAKKKAPKKKAAKKTATKPAAPKKAGKKKATKQAASKKAGKKKATKQAASKKAGKKKATKQAAPKKAAKKKATKQAAPKKAGKKKAGKKKK